jgi:hypothetical protein
MKITQRISIKNMAGERVAILQSAAGADMTKVISFNPTAEWLYNQLSGKEFQEAEVVQLLVDRFGPDEATATSDARKWIEQGINAGIITL